MEKIDMEKALYCWWNLEEVLRQGMLVTSSCWHWPQYYNCNEMSSAKTNGIGQGPQIINDIIIVLFETFT